MTHQVHGELTERGFLIQYREKTYHVRYPLEVWQATPEAIRLFLLDNLVYAATMHLPMIVPGLDGLTYTTKTPMLEPYLFQNFVRDIPSCADMDGRSPAAQTTRFLSRTYEFGPGEIRDTRSSTVAGNGGAIVPMSFGKDSLLTYAVAEELALRPLMVYVVEPSFANEERYKRALGEEFRERFGRDLFVIEHETGALRDHNHLGVPRSEYGWGLQSTEYALLMVPFACATGTSLLLFGNEQSAGSSYLDTSGTTRVYPCYDQTHLWTRHIDRITAAVTGGHLRTGSIVEPLMDMMVQYILARRYPQYAAFQMSCFVEEHSGGASRWCQACGICAKMQLLCVASGIDPAAIGFRASMLTREKAHCFPLFGGETVYPYARTGLARDEQLFAFYCALRLGSREELVCDFAGSPLYNEAVRRKAELRARFCSLYEPVSTPPSVRERVMDVYRPELQRFVRHLGEH